MTIKGRWQLKIKTPVGLQTPIVELEQNGDAISGFMEDKGERGPIDNPKLDGRTVTWTNDTQKPVPATLKFTATIAEDGALTGKVVLGPFGNASMTGEPI